MLRRCTASLALLSAVMVLAARPSHSFAASIVTENGTKYAYYDLTNTRITAVDDLLVATVTPPNSVVPASSLTGPLQIVRGSSGFDANPQVFLSPTDPNSQGLAIQFDSKQIASGGVLNFKVSLDPSYNSMTPPTLTLEAPDADLLIKSYTPAFANASPNDVVPSNTPEPMSLALWSALAGAGLLRARAFRRARRAAVAAAV